MEVIHPEIWAMSDGCNPIPDILSIERNIVLEYRDYMEIKWCKTYGRDQWESTDL